MAAPDGRLQIRSLWGLAYILPAMLLLLAFTLYPLVMVLRTAFYQKYVYITNSGTGFGLSSFRWVLEDPTFWLACQNTAILLLCPRSSTWAPCGWWLCPSPWRWPLARRC